MSLNDDTPVTDPRELERRADAAIRRFTATVVVLLVLLIIAEGVILGFLVRQISVNARRERANTDLIHACVIRKQDRFRADIAAQLAHPERGLPAADGIRCLPKRP